MRIKKAKYLEGYKIQLLFNDNKTKIVDLEKIVKQGKGMFLPLKKLDYFSQVTVDNDNISICWPNGADLCPDVLYEMGIEVNKTPSKRKTTTSSSSVKPTTRIAAKSKH